MKWSRTKLYAGVSQGNCVQRSHQGHECNKPWTDMIFESGRDIWWTNDLAHTKIWIAEASPKEGISLEIMNKAQCYYIGTLHESLIIIGIVFSLQYLLCASALTHLPLSETQNALSRKICGMLRIKRCRSLLPWSSSVNCIPNPFATPIKAHHSIVLLPWHPLPIGKNFGQQQQPTFSQKYDCSIILSFYLFSFEEKQINRHNHTTSTNIRTQSFSYPTHFPKKSQYSGSF